MQYLDPTAWMPEASDPSLKSLRSKARINSSSKLNEKSFPPYLSSPVVAAGETLLRFKFLFIYLCVLVLKASTYIYIYMCV